MPFDSVYNHLPEEEGRAFLSKLLNCSSKLFPLVVGGALFTVEIDSLVTPLILSAAVKASVHMKACCQHATWGAFLI